MSAGAGAKNPGSPSPRPTAALVEFATVDGARLARDATPCDIRMGKTTSPNVVIRPSTRTTMEQCALVAGIAALVVLKCIAAAARGRHAP